MIDFVGPATRRTSAGLARAAATIGCDVAALQADIQVEAASSGFDAHHRPKALFEPHVLYRTLSGAARESAVLQGLAYERWGTHPYPPDSYLRIEAALRIDPEAALRATSWGLPQILGENYGAAGYESATAMVAAFVSGSEDEHLAAMARFIRANPRMRVALCAHDWPTFAHLYNGPATRGYDARLAEAYRKAIAIHPTDINAHVAGVSARASRRAKGAGGIAAATTAGLAVPLILDHWRTPALLGFAILTAIVIAIAMAIRAAAFRNKALAFAATAGSAPVVQSQTITVAPAVRPGPVDPLVSQTLAKT